MRVLGLFLGLGADAIRHTARQEDIAAAPAPTFAPVYPPPPPPGMPGPMYMMPGSPGPAPIMPPLPKQGPTVADPVPMPDDEYEAKRPPTAFWHPGNPTIHHFKYAAQVNPADVPQMHLTEGKAPASQVPPLSKAMLAVLTMAAQYFFLYTIMAILRTASNFGGDAMSAKLTPTMTAALSTVNFVPMISIAILAVRIRATFLTSTPTSGGRPDEFDLPPTIAKFAFSMCSFSILTQLALIFLYPVITGKSIDPMNDIDSDGNLLQNPESGSGISGTVMKVLRHAAFFALYAGQSIICTTLKTMEAPPEIMKANAWKNQPHMPASVNGVINLVILYFTIYLGIAIVREYFPTKRVLMGSLNLCAWSVTMAPMLAILFIGARLRELQIRGSGTAGDYTLGQGADIAFYLCWISLHVQCGLIILVVFLKGDLEQGDFYGDVRFIMTNLTAFMWLHVVRWISQLSLYGGLIAVTVAIRNAEHPLGPSHTPKLSPAMECTLSLTAQFFFVYVGIFIVSSVRQFANGALLVTMKVFYSAQTCVMFCPMLCVLFLGARARALEITQQKGSPQGWVQQCMEAATFATLLQLIFCMLLPILVGGWDSENNLRGVLETDPDGNVKGNRAQMGSVLYYVVETFRYICMIFMYGGALGVVAGMMLMTPENCTGEGTIPLLGNVIPKIGNPLASDPAVKVAPSPAFF